MTFKFECPTCGQRILAAQHDIGTTGGCPNCQSQFVVPEPVQLSTTSIPPPLPKTGQSVSPQKPNSRWQTKLKGLSLLALFVGPLFLALNYNNHQDRKMMVREGVEADAEILQRNQRIGSGKRRSRSYSFDISYKRENGETQRAVLSVPETEFLTSSPVRIRYLRSNPRHVVSANQKVDRPEEYAVSGIITLLGLSGGYVYWWPRKRIKII